MEVLMKTIIRLIIGCAAAALILSFLPACEQQQPTPASKQTAKPAATEKVADTGLVPDQASTGEPPLIPHEVEQTDSGEECLGCHGTGEDAPKIPDWHATLVDCQQCHVVKGTQISNFKPKY
jgi:nitrate reductase cytochrome c-type subunit